MKKYVGIVAGFAFFVIGVFANDLTEVRGTAMPPMVQEESFDVPGMEEEIEALISEVPEVFFNCEKSEAEEAKKEELYRLLKKDAALTSYSADIFEEVYDPREKNLVTSVKNQQSNTCWAFSSLAAGEESLIYKGMADAASLDLSEAQLIYFFYHPVEDPLGNTIGDGNYNGSSLDYMGVGSNTIFSTFELANWVGAADEKLMPFEELNAESVYEETYAYQDVAHLQNAYWINFKDVDAVNVVKQMIKQYGAAAINFYYGSTYFNKNTCAYYFPLNPSQANNHSATIVGWDDTYSKNNFKAANRPNGDGAWIVKNSYGESWGDGGYFYLSYEDSSVNSANTNANRARAYIFDFESADNYDYNYQYDGSAGAYNASNSNSALTRIDSGNSIANVFTVQNKGNGHTETLKAVSFALYDTAVSYSIQIYKNLTDATDPTSGTPQLETPVTGGTSYAGYYTVSIEHPVLLREGETFSVVVTLSKESGEQVNFFIDKTYQNGNWISFRNSVKEGQSFRYIDGNWQDMEVNGATARIKAFTDENNASAEWIQKLSLVPSGMQQEDETYLLELWMGETYQIQVSIYPEYAATKTIKWTSLNPETVIVNEDGILTAVKNGIATIKGETIDGSELSVSFLVKVKKHADTVALSSEKLELYIGESVALTAELFPQEASEEVVSWKTSDESVATVDEHGFLEAVKAGEAVITACLASNSAVQDICQITVKEKEDTKKDTKKNNKKDTEKEMTVQSDEKTSTDAEKAAEIKATGVVETSDDSVELMLFWWFVLVLGVSLVQKNRNVF